MSHIYCRISYRLYQLIRYSRFRVVLIRLNGHERRIRYRLVQYRTGIFDGDIVEPRIRPDHTVLTTVLTNIDLRTIKEGMSGATITGHYIYLDGGYDESQLIADVIKLASA